MKRYKVFFADESGHCLIDADKARVDIVHPFTVEFWKSGKLVGLFFVDRIAGYQVIRENDGEGE